MSIDDMNTRKQFGAAIGGFQALTRRALSRAKVRLGQSMHFVGRPCVQLQGGIGVTDEDAGSHDLERLTAMEMSFGDTLRHLGEVSRRMQDQSGVFA